MKKIELYLFVIILLIIGSCDVKKEPIPAYLHIKPFEVNVEANGSQGTAASKITDAWVSLEETGDFLGVYELPMTLPIIADGNTKLIIEPGIIENGISNTPNKYPFLTWHKVEVDFAANQTDTIQPVSEYDSRVVFHYVENFDNTNSLSVNLDSASTLQTFTTPTDAFGGSGKSVSIDVDEDNPIFEVATFVKMELPKVDNRVFIEMHYKNESILQVGLARYKTANPDPFKGYFFALNPKDEWNKIYIEVTNELVESADNINEFQLMFGAVLPEGETTSKILIDNIKIISLKD